MAITVPVAVTRLFATEHNGGRRRYGYGLSCALPGQSESPATYAIRLNIWRPMPDRLKAVGLMCLAVTLFACLDTTAKYLGSHLGVPTAEIVWVRFLGQALLMTAILGPARIPKLLQTKRLSLQLVRSTLMVATTVCNFVAVQYLRLDQTISIAFLAPLVVAALAGPFLGEYVGRHRACAIVVGFIGILIVVRPGITEFHPAFLAAFLSMAVYSLFMIVTRKLSDVDPPLVTLFYSLLVGVFAGAVFAIPQWVWPSSAFEWLLLSMLGALGGFGHYLLIHAYRLAPASSVSPFLYFQLLSMTGLGFLVFGDVPDRWSVIGSAVVVLSGIYLVHRERVAHIESRTAAMERQAL